MVAAMVTVRPELEALAASRGRRARASASRGDGAGSPADRRASTTRGSGGVRQESEPYYVSLIRLNEQLKRGSRRSSSKRRPTSSKTTTCSRWSTLAWPRLPSWTIISPGSGARSSLALRSIRILPSVQVATWPSHFARTIPGFGKSSTSGSGSTEKVTLPKRHRAPLSEERRLREECRRRRRAAEVPGGGGILSEYGAQYNLDYLLMAAQGYQESTLDQNVKRRVGAVGIMQVMPPTGRELEVGDITQVDANVHAGVDVHAVHDGSILRGRGNGPVEQNVDDLFAGDRRRTRTREATPARGREAPTRSELPVRQRRACRVGTDRLLNGHGREQYLQVRHHLPVAQRPARQARRGEGRGRDAEVTAIARSPRV